MVRVGKTMKNFKCKKCGEFDDKVGNEVSGYTIYHYDIETGDYSTEDNINDGTTNDFYCLHCNHNLTTKELDKYKIR